MTIDFKGFLFQWFEKTIVSEQCYLDILWVLKNEVPELETFVHSLNNENKNSFEIMPLGKTLGLLTVPEDIKDNFLGQFENFYLDKISKNDFSLEGLINILGVIDRLGNYISSEKDKYIIDLLSKFTPEQAQKFGDKLADCLNSQEWFSTKNIPKEFNSYDEWRNVGRSMPYIPFNSTPTDLLILLFNTFENKINCFEIFVKLKPIIKIIIMYYHMWTFQDKVTEEEILGKLTQNQIEPELIANLILSPSQISHNKNLWQPTKIIEWLIKNNWDSVGKRIFNSIFSSTNENITNDYKQTTQVINQSIPKLLQNEELRNNIINSLKWPYDFEAFSNWLSFISKETNEINFENLIIPMNQNWINFFDSLSSNLQEIITEDKWISSELSLNVYENKFQQALAYSLWFILKAEVVDWEKWIKSLQNLLFKIKPLFYSSYRVNFQAARLSEFVLMFLLSFINLEENEFTEQTKIRLKEMLNKFEKILLFPYIRFAERSSIIWDEKVYDSSQVEKELFIINQFLKFINTNPTRKEIAAEFLESFKNIMTTPWPWLRISEQVTT